MTEIATLGLRIVSDDVPRATTRLKEFEGQADRTEKRAAAMGAVVGRALGVIGAALSVRELAGYADAWSDMQSRVGAAIKDMDAAPAMMQRMVDLANASYSPLDQTVAVYSRNVGVLRDLGRNAAEAADFTEALNHALVVTATRGERAASVQNALSKAMAVGKLQADGLETVLANGGRVAEALAAELNTTVSGLRSLASQGKITGDVISSAMIDRLGELRAEAAEMPATIGDAFTRLQTNLTAFIGTMDKTYGVSARVSEAIMFLAGNIENAVPVVAGLATVIAVSLLPALGSTTMAVAALTAALLANPFIWVALAAGGAVAAYLFLTSAVREAEGAIRSANDAYASNATAMEASMNASGGYTAALRNQVAMQVEAAKSAITLAEAEWAAAASRAQAFRKFFGFGFEPLDFDANVKSMNIRVMDEALAKLQSQLATIDANIIDSPIVPMLEGVGTAAAAANDNVKTLGTTLTDAARSASQEWEFYRATFSGFSGDLKRGLKEGQSFWEALGNAGANALDKIADRALSMAANGIFDMIFGAAMGGIGGNSLGGGWGVAGGFGKPGIFGIPGMATGGTVGRAGLSWVGENGPELLRLPRGAEVIPNGPSLSMAANQNPGPQRVQLEVSLSVDESGNIVPLMRQVAGQVADMRVDYNNRKVMPRMINDMKGNSMVVNG
ncbi:tape measure protein [Devosia chinhatensis]|uniref:Tape measure protein N-terminal domain-containing protein n=1 Tax=Devosia chinhatensis TaxID=429727 RepID=A0A0F5FLG3_9HYPH|nr:tape measure domain-containing protein [Devosia chinhatensis]KKB09410.1 hypothetical protein VE26_05600 [Devosia chinhatensis]